MTVQELLEQAVAGGVAPGFVAVLGNRDGLVAEAAAGEAGPDTIFRVASMTKAMTSVAALQLVERGELALEQPVGDVLPSFGDLEVLEGFDGDEPTLRPPKQPVLIRHLMTHTSGLGYWFSSADILRWHELTGTPPILAGKLASIRTPLLHDPGERWTYGVSTDWLGQVIEAASGKSLEDYLREHVWGPINMPDATFYPTDEQRERMPPLMFRTPDGELVEAPLEDVEWEFASGGGGGHATARDYARFQRMLLRGGELDGERVLAPETVELMFTDHLHGAPLPEVMESAVPELCKDVPAMPFRQGWGLGLHLLLEDIPGMRRAGSGDWAGLFNCYFWIDRQSGLTAALMTQLLPFFDDRMVETLLGFEAAVYAQVGGADSMSVTSQILKVHERIYKATDGRVGHNMIGVPTLLLRTTGRRSGATRTNALVYARDGADYLVVASNGGAPKHPAWLHNLRANADVEIQVARERRPGRARIVEPSDPDYKRLWQLVNENNKDRYTVYQEQTSRTIPVVAVTPN